jgi:hypothetical protein
VTNLPTLHQIITGSVSMPYRNVPQSKRNRDQNGAKTRKESAILPKTGIQGEANHAGSGIGLLGQLATRHTSLAGC